MARIPGRWLAGCAVLCLLGCAHASMARPKVRPRVPCLIKFPSLLFMPVLVIAWFQVSHASEDSLEVQSRQFVHEAVEAIARTWDSQELVSRASSELAGSLDPDSLENLFFQFQGYGPLVEIIRIEGGVDGGFTSGFVPRVQGRYRVFARCEAADIEIEVESERQRNGDWLLMRFFMISAEARHGSEMGATPGLTLAELEALVEQHRVAGQVEISRHRDRFYELADRYSELDRPDDALRILELVIKMDTGNIARQYQLAELAHATGDGELAGRAATHVHEFAEEISLRSSARGLMSDLGLEPIARVRSDQVDVEALEILLVPVGDPDQSILEEFRAGLQEQLGMKFRISERALPLGDPDRSWAFLQRRQSFEFVRDKLTNLQHDQILKALAIEEQYLQGQNIDRYIEFVLARSGGGGARELEIYQERVRELEDQPQYDGSRLLLELRQAFFGPRDQDGVRGYIAVTDQDIFNEDSNFVFSLGNPRFIVFSWHRFLARVNGEEQNRPRFIERALKQGTSATLTLLGFEKCNDQRCVTAWPGSVAAVDAKGTELCDEHHAQVDRFKEGVNQVPPLATRHFKRGLEYSGRGDHQSSIGEYRRALEYDPGSAAALLNLGDLLRETGELIEAEEVSRRAVMTKPYYAPARHLYGMVLAMNGKGDQALQELGVAAKFKPDDAEIATSLGYAQYRVGKLDDAINTLSVAIELDPSMGVAYYNLALVYYSRGDYQQAWDAANEAKGAGYAGAPAFWERLEAALERDAPRQ